MIRVMWAYMYGLLEVAIALMNHSASLILDEPRQQEATRFSLDQFMPWYRRGRR